MSNQSLRQASIRAVTGTQLTYEGDWHALFDLYGIASGAYNDRLLAFINVALGTSYTELNGAMAAYAEFNGADSWNELGNMSLFVANTAIASNRNNIMENPSNGLSRYVGVSRVKRTGQYGGRGMKFRDCNWYVNSSGVETNTGNAITITRAVELDGVRYQVKWSGATSISIADGAMVESDALTDGGGNPVYFPPNTNFKVRTWVDCGVGGRYPYGAACRAALGDEFENGGAVTDKTMVGTWGTSGYFLSYDASACFFTETQGIVRDIVMYGDSIGFGWNVIDEITTNTLNTGDVYGNEGPLQRLFNAYNGTPLLTMCRPSDRVAYQDAVGAITKRIALAAGLGTDLVIQGGSNDLYAGGQTVASLKTLVESVITKANTDGRPNVAVVTICPRTTSTDSWATQANQTISGSATNVIRNAWNDTILALAISGQTYAVDLGGAVDDGTGKWKVDGGAYTNDGIHFVENGAQKASAYMDANAVPYNGYEAETVALLGRMTTTQTTTRKGQINTAMAAFKTSGALAKLDTLYILAAADSQAGLLNWAATANNLTATNSPTFTADRGYTFDGSTNYLTSGLNPSLGGVKFVLNNASMGAWLIGPFSANARSGNDLARIGIDFSTPNYYARANDATTVTTSTASTNRLMAWSRSSSTQYIRYINGANTGTISNASTALFNGVLDIGRATTLFGAGGFRAWYSGQSLSDSEQLAMFNAIQAYMVAVGAE